MVDNVAKAAEFKNLGNKAFTEEKFEEALDYFTKAIELNPNDHVFYSNRSGCYASLKNYQEALNDANKCISIKPDWAKGYTRKGLAQFYLNDYDGAIQTYEGALQIDPNNQQLKTDLARAQDAKNKKAGPMGADPFTQQLFAGLLKNPKTRDLLKDPAFMQKLSMLQSNPAMMSTLLQDPQMQMAFGAMFGGEGEEGNPFAGGFPGAGEEEHVHGENCSHDHGPPPGHGQKMEEEPKKEEPKPAHKPSEPVSEPEQEKQKGNEAYIKKEFETALIHYNKAIELNPLELIYYNNKAAVYIEQKNFKEALNTVDHALKIMEENHINDYQKKAKLFARKGTILASLENFDESIKFLEKSLMEDMNQKVKDEKRRVEKLKKDTEEQRYINPELGEKERELGNELFKQGKWPEALKHYEEAIRRNPKDVKAHSNKGTCLIKLMDFPGASKSLEKALEIDPNFVKALTKKGVVHQTMKEFHKALACFEKGMALEPSNEECKAGLEQTRMMLFAQGGGEDQQERAKKSMQDPEIQAILREPEIVNLLKDLQENPRSVEARAALSKPDVAKKIEKLVAAGILSIG